MLLTFNNAFIAIFFSLIASQVGTTAAIPCWGGLNANMVPLRFAIASDVRSYLVKPSIRSKPDKFRERFSCVPVVIAVQVKWTRCRQALPWHVVGDVGSWYPEILSISRSGCV